MKIIRAAWLIALISAIAFCSNTSTNSIPTESEQEIVVGAERLSSYLPLLTDKQVALVVNQTSILGEDHLVDVLLENGVDIKTIFAPEHGFRGKADAGEKVKDQVDVKTGLPIISLYGNNYKPTAEQLDGIDVVVFDIQDVGARFYTYISTMHYVMEACAENDISFLVLDRPNPNGHYVDGPVLDKDFASFVGVHKIPVVHGLTMAELATMIIEEYWINKADQLEFHKVLCQNYDHTMPYELPVKPSPNLLNKQSIALYPSLCLFEGTVVSIGRGTNMQFQVVGHPELRDFYDFSFRPLPNEGASSPKHNGKVCYGIDVRKLNADPKFDISYLIEFYDALDMGKDFFLENHFIDNLAGTDELRKMILEGMDEEVIRLSWEADLMAYKEMRKQYLLYKDFE